MKKTSILAGIFILLAANTFSQTVSDMLERSLSSVVTVAVYRIQENKEVLGYRGAPKGSDVAYEKTLDLSEALTKGSGFVINRNGKYYVITNAHVVESASEEPGSIYVYTISRGKDEVRIVGGDSFYDVAVLEFVTNPDSDVTYLDFKKEEPRIGETVYAIGNPLGEYPYTVTNGIISAKNRVREGITGKFGFLQTTATIIWGNSGGPLLDMNGKVAGINSQIAFAKAPNGEEIIQSQINFALEAAIAERIINDVLTNNGRVNRAFLGLEISQKFSMSYDWYSGNSIYQEDSLPVITGVIPGSPAYSLMANKIGAEILKINGVAVRNVEEALGELEKVKPQSPVKLTVLKNGLREEVTIVPSALRSEELEEIARYVLGKNQEIVLNENDPDVSFTLAMNDFYQYSEKKFYKSNQMNTYREKYVVFAAGIIGDDGENMWKVDNYSDLGGALKLSGLQGVIDLKVKKEGDPYSDEYSLRQYLSGNEKIIQSTLWY